MADIVIKTEDKKEEIKPVERSEIEKGLTTAMELKKMQEENDALEREIMRREELRNRQLLGGKTLNQAEEKSQADKDKEEAQRILGMFR